MAEGVFTIIEQNRMDGIPGERFDWTADNTSLGVDTPAARQDGGFRACPQGEWTISGKLRTVRTEYPGSVRPTEQVLGPAYEDQVFEGVWDDRFNFPGYAEAEMRRFEAMCRRGNAVEISFQAQSFTGIITSWRFPYKQREEIRYNFRVSTHARTDERVDQPTPVQELSPIEAYNKIALTQSGLELNEELKPAEALDATLSADVDAALATLNSDINDTGDTVYAREIGTDVTNQGLRPYKRLATHFRNVQASANDVVDQFDSVKSDVEMLYNSALKILDFEEWYRTMNFRCRLMMADSIEAAKIMEARDEPDAAHLYQPQEKESLMDIARRFYGNPYAWRLISERNNLSKFIMEGNETLIIPDRISG